MSAMARELVEKAGVGESADAIWRELDQERDKAQPHVITPECEEVLPIPTGPPATTVAEHSTVWAGIHLVDPPVSSKKRRKADLWPTATDQGTQLTLFG